MQTILITGATGAIGKKLTQVLKARNYDVKIFIHVKQPDSKSNRLEHFSGDLLNPESLLNATKSTDTIIHLAGLTHTHQQKKYYQINLTGTQNLIRASEQNNVKKFIYLSSRAASLNGGPYAHSKYLAEQAVIHSKLNWIILAPAEVYGANNREAIARLIKIMTRSPLVPIIGRGQYTINPIYINDLMEAILVAIENKYALNKKYILAGPQEFTQLESIDTICDYFKLTRIKIYLPLFFFKFLSQIAKLFNSEMLVADQIPRLLCKKSSDITLAKQNLNFNPIDFSTGLKKTFPFYDEIQRECKKFSSRFSGK